MTVEGSFELTDDMLREKSPREATDPKRMFGSNEITQNTRDHVDVVTAEIESASEEVFALVPRCAERTLSLRHMELASFYAHAALVREGVEDEKKEGGFIEVDRRQKVRARVEEMVSRAMKLSEVYLCESRTNAVALLRKLVDQHAGEQKR